MARRPAAPEMPAPPKPLLVPVSAEDHALVTQYAAALGLPSIEAGAGRILAEWAGQQRIRDEARRRRGKLRNR